MSYMIILLIKIFSEPFCHVEGGILEEITTIMTEIFHYRIKVISEKNFVLIYIHHRTNGPKPYLQNVPYCMQEPLFFPLSQICVFIVANLCIYSNVKYFKTFSQWQASSTAIYLDCF